MHLVNRWRHRSVPWAAMEFLLRAARETRGTKKTAALSDSGTARDGRGGTGNGLCAAPARKLFRLGELRIE
ncbi:hypothetical protein [Akkermansia muciniphila]|uniref:hypothetical protein n=1 Tax=Akkermansia muciniphila TaxID=239935 RepID=UPI003CCEA285